MRAPRVSVLLPAFDAEAFVSEAVESILRQSWRDLELIVIDDGSRDATAERVASFSDPRLRLIRNERNLHVAASLNRGLDAARGEFVARMDADDVAHPERLARQLALLEARPEVGLCGSWIRSFGGPGAGVTQLPVTHAAIAATLPIGNPIAHPTVVFRRALFERLGLRYREEFWSAEDYELWTRAAPRVGMAGVPEPLLDLRLHAGRVSEQRFKRQRRMARRVRRGALTQALGREPSELELAVSGFEEPPPDGVDEAVLLDLFAALRRGLAWLGPEARERLDVLLARLRARLRPPQNAD